MGVTHNINPKYQSLESSILDIHTHFNRSNNSIKEGRNHLKIVELLIENDVNMAVQGSWLTNDNSGFIAACIKGKIKMADLLIHHGAWLDLEK